MLFILKLGVGCILKKYILDVFDAFLEALSCICADFALFFNFYFIGKAVISAPCFFYWKI